MFLDIHGARGSMPVGTVEYSGFGGDTTCYTLHHDDGSLVAIVDAGTGLRMALPSLANGASVATFVMTHYHWDHIQGLSMCAPMWAGEMSLRIIGPGDPASALSGAITPPWFPVAIRDMDIEFIPAPESFKLGDVTVTSFPLHHPQGGLGYRFDHNGSSIVVATDHEAGSEVDRQLIDVSAGADIMVHDAQYLPSEYPSKIGWGHSTWEHAVEVSQAAQVSHMVVASHDPARSDDQVTSLLDAASERFPRVSGAASGSRIETG